MVRANPGGNSMIFYWSARDTTAKNEIKSDVSLSSRFAQLNREGVYLLEILEAATGKPAGKLLLDTGKGSFRIENVTAEGDWILVTDNENRTLVYSLSSGERKATLFGSHSAISVAAQALAVGNEAGEIDIYSLPMVEKREHLSFSSPVSVASFSADGQRLFVLTANQTAYVLDTAHALWLKFRWAFPVGCSYLESNSRKLVPWGISPPKFSATVCPMSASVERVPSFRP